MTEWLWYGKAFYADIALLNIYIQRLNSDQADLAIY